LNKIRVIDQDVLNELITVTSNNIRSLLKSANDLLEMNIKQNQDILFDHPFVSAGLFTYAIEEYGKLIYLKSLKPINKKVELDYFGKFTDHNTKFRLAFEHLPKEAMYDIQFFDSTLFDTEKSKATKDTRFNIFYSDLTNGGKIRTLPQVNAGILKKAILKFSKIVNSEKS